MVAPKSSATLGLITTGNQLTIAKPSNVVTGDILVAFIRSQVVTENGVEAPTGWVLIGPEYDDGVSGGRVNLIFAKTATSSEPAEYEFTTTSRAIGVISLWSKDDLQLNVTGVSSYRGSWDTPGGYRALDTYEVSSASVAFLFGGSEILDGYSHVPDPVTPNYIQIAQGQTGSGTTASRTALWVGYAETTPGMSPQGYVAFAGTSGEAVQGVSLKRLSYTPPPALEDRIPTVAKITTGSSLLVDKPSAAVQGDVLLAFVRSQAQNAPDAIPPEGWTRVGIPYDQNSGARVTSVFMKVVGASEPSNYMFQTSARAIVVVQSFDKDLVDPVMLGYADHHRGVWKTDISGRETPSFSADGKVIQFAFAAYEVLDGSPAGLVVKPPGFTTIAEEYTPDTGTVGSRTSVWIGYKTRYSDGESTYATFPATAGEVLQSFALRHKEDSPTTAGFLFDGASRPVFPYLATNGSTRLVGGIQLIRRGFLNTQEMLQTPGFTWAHRGLTTFAEESHYAYTRAAMRGHGALELSLGRTSDGVFVGTHDNNLNRVSGQSDLPRILDMTWAQVQELSINVGEGSPRPFMRLEEILETYAKTHIMIFDLKNYSWGTHLDYFLDMIAHLPHDRIIFKQMITDQYTPVVADSNGYASWGYAYAITFDQTNFAQVQAPWTYLGMEHAASQAVWDATLAFGKPVIGHIADTQDHYDSAINKGAAGVQTTGYAVNPVSWWNT